MTGETPIALSRRLFRNFWQDYRVYPDRVELSCRVLFHTFVIPASEIVAVSVRPAALSRASFRDPRLLFTSALKLDLSDLFPHVLLTRARGLFHNLCFTPDDPQSFFSALMKIKRTPALPPPPLDPR